MPAPIGPDDMAFGPRVLTPRPPGEPELEDAAALFSVANPLDWTEEKSALMLRACRAMAAFHQARCPELRFIYERQGFDPALLRDEASLELLPPLGVSALKRYTLSSKGRAQALALRLTSSGTGGQPTEVWRDAQTHWRLLVMRNRLIEQLGIANRRPTNYLIFTHKPKALEESFLVRSINHLRAFAPEIETFHAVQVAADGRLLLDQEQAIAKLKCYAAAGQPVRILGLPAFIHETLQVLERQGPIHMPPDSWVFTAGGWKAEEDRVLSRDAFRAKIVRLLGVPDQNINDGYSMAEHGVGYRQCRLHKFHIPVCARILVRDPVTLAALPPGNVGLLELITPLNSMMPTLAILSTDIGLLDPDNCGCGLRSPTFTLLGRGGVIRTMTCAMRMEEMTSREETVRL